MCESGTGQSCIKLSAPANVEYKLNFTSSMSNDFLNETMFSWEWIPNDYISTPPT